MKFPFLLLLFFIPDTIGFSQSGNGEDVLWNPRVYMDNDRFAGEKSNADDNYTGGMLIEVVTNKFNDKKCILSPLSGDINTRTFSLGFTNYTPQDIGATEILFDDRPFACYLYGAFGARSISSEKGLSINYGINAGLYGTDLGRIFQTRLHELDLLKTGRVVPQGWHNQIGHGGRFVVNGNFGVEKVLFSWSILGLTGLIDANIGPSLTGLSIAPRFSIGTPIGLNRLYFPDIFISLDGGQKQRKFQWELFAKPTLRLVAWNATLNGFWINDETPNKIDYSDLHHAFFEFEGGISFQIYGFQFGASYRARTKEFSYQNKSLHQWAGYFIGYQF